MKKRNILRVAKAIETHSVPGLGFNISVWYSNAGRKDYTGRNCGTVACIGGWAAEVLNKGDPHRSGTSHLFGISEDQNGALIMPPYYSTRPGLYTPAAAVAVLRHLAKTGEVDWPRAITTARNAREE